jgi:rhomboid protease GluP
MDGMSDETLASYVARYCMARENYSPGLPPEAADLAQACDFALARLAWGSLQILCIVDGQAHPGRQFAMMPEQVREIARACRKYCGTISLSKMPAVIEIVEISNQPVSEQDRARLKHYRRSSIFSKAVVWASHYDAQARQSWNNRWRFNRSTVQQVLRKPIVSTADLRIEAETRPLPSPPKHPVVTFCILAGLLAVFGLEMVLSHGAEPDLATLISLGGLNVKLIRAGEWWRAVSATVLHGGLGHILANGFSLYMAGRVLENMVGRRWFGATYVIAGLCGSLASIVGSANVVVSVGASGAIMGVVAAAAICGLTRRRADFGGEASQLLVGGLAPTLGLAVWGGERAANIDHFAHFGGALGGALAALAMLALWRRTDDGPMGRHGAAVIAGLGCLALAYAAVEVAQTRPAYAITLGPNRELAGNLSAQFRRAPQLVELYPDDPRAHFALGLARYQQRDFTGAEKALRTALGMDKTLLLYFDASLANRIRSALVATLLAGGRNAAAREEAVPLCNLPPNSPLLETYWKEMMPTVCN